MYGTLDCRSFFLALVCRGADGFVVCGFAKGVVGLVEGVVIPWVGENCGILSPAVK